MSTVKAMAVAASCTVALQVASEGVVHAQADVFDRVTHGYAVSEGGVKIHYASLGEGPLVVMVHGFPDFWHSWRLRAQLMEGT